MMTARTPLECQLYIELHACDCGGALGDLAHRLITRDDTLCARYQGRCRGCGADLEYVFALDPEIAAPTAFGGASPSTIIDAGQYMAASERAARQAQVGGSSDQRASARPLVTRAVACLDEVLKWIPVGGDRVPMSAFFTNEGRRVYEDEPGRFRRERVLAVRAAYRELLLRLG